jgi:hypothetical protein
MMDTIPYRWTKIKNGIGQVAIVTLAVAANENNKNEILEYYAGAGFTSHGSIEEVPADGYDSWKIAVRNGLSYGFSLAKGFWKVSIYRIEGRAFIDTNPTVVGYTAFRAFCSQIGLQLEDGVIEMLEQFVDSSWTKPYKELIPDFFNLTFTKYDKQNNLASR